MATPFESASLNLRLFELRREPVLREARAWFLTHFNPASFDELMAVAGGEHNAFFRMVLGYWDMAASMVTFGAIDAEMFRAAHSEIVGTFAKIEPYLEQLREVSGVPDFLVHLEQVVRGMPGASERLEALRQQFKAAARH